MTGKEILRALRTFGVLVLFQLCMGLLQVAGGRAHFELTTRSVIWSVGWWVLAAAVALYGVWWNRNPPFRQRYEAKRAARLGK